MYLQATGSSDGFSRRGVQCPGSCQYVLQQVLSVEQTVGTQRTHPEHNMKIRLLLGNIQTKQHRIYSKDHSYRVIMFNKSVVGKGMSSFL